MRAPPAKRGRTRKPPPSDVPGMSSAQADTPSSVGRGSSGVAATPEQQLARAVSWRTEQQLTRAILEAINGVPGCIAWRNNCGYRGRVHFGLAVGSADIIACVCGKFVGLEVKLPAKKLRAPYEVRWRQLSDDQQKWITRVVECGGVAEVVWSVDEAVHIVMHVLACSKLGVRV